VIARVSDLSLGRKGTFFLTMTLIGVGVALITVDMLYVKAYLEKAALMLLGYAMADVGVEGEVPVALNAPRRAHPGRVQGGGPGALAQL